MSDSALPQLDRLTELQADRALFGLDDAEQHELRNLLSTNHQPDDESLDRVAATAQLAMLAVAEPLPVDIASVILTQGQEFFQPTQISPSSTTPSKTSTTPKTSTVIARREWFAWLAVAASIVFALLALNRATSLDPSANELRAELLAQAETEALTQVAWTVSEGAKIEAESGDVVWHNGRQQGVMKFTGLPANDPTVEQYQLWIFDAEQDERYPIDGGVFDVPAGGEEVLVKIDAKLPVAEPTMFAITIEKPGGVVVSSRERLPLLAQVEKK